MCRRHRFGEEANLLVLHPEVHLIHLVHDDLGGLSFKIAKRRIKEAEPCRRRDTGELGKCC